MTKRRTYETGPRISTTGFFNNFAIIINNNTIISLIISLDIINDQMNKVESTRGH